MSHTCFQAKNSDTKIKGIFVFDMDADRFTKYKADSRFQSILEINK